MANTPDKVVIELKRRSLEADVEAIARTHFASVYATCLRITRNPHDAEDAAQAVFLCLSIQLRSGSRIKALGPWLNQVARRAAIDVCRRRKRRQHYEAAFASEAHPSTSGEEEPNWAEIRPAVITALNELPAKYRLPLVMHYFGGMDQEQLAAELSCSRVNLRVRMHRGHKMLRDLLQRRGVQLAGGMLVAALADAVQHQVSQSLVGASVAHAGQLSAAAFGGSQGLVAIAGMSAVRLKVLLAAAVAIAGFAAATAPLLARLKGEWQEIPFRPTIEGLPALPSFTPPVPRFSETADAPEDAVARVNESERAAEPARGVASVRLPVFDHPPVGDVAIQAPASPDVLRPARGAVAVHTRNRDVPEAVAVRTPASPPIAFANGSARAEREPVLVRDRRRHASHSVDMPWVPVAAHALTISTAFKSAWLSGSELVTNRADYTTTWGDTSMDAVVKYPGPSELVNNGQVIADHRSRDFSSFGRVLNTQENVAGVNGWFAAHGGSITLPPIRLTKGENRRNWGESDWDSSIDLINSMTIEAEAASVTNLTISLLATDHALVPPLPAGHHFVGIWKMTGGQTLTDGLDLTIRYDDTRLTYLGLDESFVKLWYYGAGGWTRVTDESFRRDTTLNHVSGHVPAVGFYGVSTPEPAGAMFVILAGGAALLRRRRGD